MNKFFKIIAWPVLLAPLAYLALAWDSLPARVATHFDIHGNPDKYDSKSGMWLYISIIVAVSIAIYILLPLTYRIDPRKTAVDNKTRLQRLAFVLAIFISFVGCLLINSSIQGKIRLNMRLVFGSMGLLWCILGNYFYNIKPNYFAGLRLPWTLNDEDNWKKTHWLAGKLWFAGGLLILAAALFLPRTSVIVTTVCIALLIIMIPAVYSYKLYKKKKAH